MPQLPSGQHVAIDPRPLETLLAESGSAFNAHHLMVIGQIDDLYRWYDVLILHEAESLPPVQRAAARLVEAAPAGLVGLPAGRLIDWHDVARSWTADDRKAFQSFVNERVRPWAVAMWPEVQSCRAKLLEAPTLAGAFAQMWRLGVHPLQTEPDED